MTNGGTGGSAEGEGYRGGVDLPRDVSRRRAETMAKRERATGLDPEDDATRWLEQHEPKPEPVRPKSASKSKALHRWRRQRGS